MLLLNAALTHPDLKPLYSFHHISIYPPVCSNMPLRAPVTHSERFYDLSDKVKKKLVQTRYEWFW